MLNIVGTILSVVGNPSSSGLLGMLNIVGTILKNFYFTIIIKFARYAKYCRYYTFDRNGATSGEFARYAKYCRYYTYKILNDLSAYVC